MSGTVVNVRSPAKLNLALAVGPRRADGMHPICSWMVTVDLYDDLEVKRLPPDRLSRYAILWHEDARRKSEIDWSITADLAVRAHLALEEHVGRKLPVQLKIEKRIPVCGGLGGGSANAAGILHAINELFALGLGHDELAAVGATVGSDVPFLVHGGSAVVEGLGEQVARHEALPELHFVVAMPGLECTTGHVYGRFDELPGGPLQPDAVHALADGALARDASPLRPDALFNDLTRAAIRTAPELDDLVAHLGALAERPAHVSGSGSSVFVLCDDAIHAEYLARAFEETHEIPSTPVKTVTGVTLSAEDDSLAAADQDRV